MARHHQRVAPDEKRRRQEIRKQFGLKHDAKIVGKALVALNALREKEEGTENPETVQSETTIGSETVEKNEHTEALKTLKTVKSETFEEDEHANAPENPVEEKNFKDTKQNVQVIENAENGKTENVDKPVEDAEVAGSGDVDEPVEDAEVTGSGIIAKDFLVRDEITKLPLDLIHNEPPRMYGTGFTTSAIIIIDGQIIPGYDVRTARTLSKPTFVGLCSYVTVSLDNTQIPDVVVTVKLYTIYEEIPVFKIAIPLNVLGLQAEYNEVDIAGRELLFPSESELYFHLAAEKMKTLPEVVDTSLFTLALPRTSARFSFAPNFMSRVNKLGGEYVRVGKQLEGLVAAIKQKDTISVTMACPTQPGGATPWPAVEDYLYPTNPLTSLMPERGTVREMTGKKIRLPAPVPNVARPLPIPATTRFYSTEHRQVMLMAPAADELRFETIRSDLGANTNVWVKFFPLPAPWIETEEEQMLKYGQMVADGRPTEYFAVAQITPYNKNLLGDIGDAVRITTESLTAESHPHPNVGDDIFRMTESLFNRFQGATTAAHIAVYNAKKAAIRRENEDLEEGATPVEDLPDFDGSEIFNEAFCRGMRRHLVDYISDEMVQAFAAANPTDETINAIAHTADGIATELRQGEDEEDDAFFERVRAWIVGHPPVQGVDRYGERGLTFHGRRVPALPGVVLHHALYLISRARQPDYPTAYKAPYLLIDFPELPFSGSIAEFSKSTFFDTPGKTNDENANRPQMESTAGAVRCKISVKVDPTTIKHEMTAVHRMLQTPVASDGAVIWEHFQHFQDFPEDYRRDLLSDLPGLKSLAGRTDVPPSLLQKLSHTKAGKMFVSGCPGSGKSRLLLNIAVAALTDKYYPRSKIETGTPNQATVTQLDKDTEAELNEALHGVDPKEGFAQTHIDSAPVAVPASAPVSGSSLNPLTWITTRFTAPVPAPAPANGPVAKPKPFVLNRRAHADTAKTPKVTDRSQDMEE